MRKSQPDQILDHIYQQAVVLKDTVISDSDIRERVTYVCNCMSNRAGVRLLMACLLGKLHNPSVDPRKPYTEIGGSDSFSGRTYDEKYIIHFINRYRLPVNPTTAFLTPTLRNIDYALETHRDLVGRPRDLYKKTLQLLDDVAGKRIDAKTLFVEVVRLLLQLRDEKLSRMNSLLKELSCAEDALPLSSEAIVNLINQHLSCRNASRLPVLIVTAAYQTIGERLSERVLPLHAHNAADLQTGCIGDVEICLVGDDSIVTAYEMKTKRVTSSDIVAAIAKILKLPHKIDNYIFITTDAIDKDVSDYAASLYEETGGTEFVILDCISFLRHFLHLFHRFRLEYLNIYQGLVLSEPDSAVSQTLKEAFLALRQVAVSGEGD